MTYFDVFWRVASYIESLGLEVDFECGKPLTERQIRARGKNLSIPLPGSLVDLYREMGDGVWLSWDADHGGGDGSGPFAMVEFEPLGDLIARFEHGKSYSVEWADDYDYSGTRDPVLARATALGMRSWFPFLEEGNGDSLCLDSSAPECPVVFNQHDWMDGGTGENGSPMGASLFEFLEDWSRVCFQCPSSLWWPSVNSPRGPKWSSREFRNPFRISW
jgi:SMI1 / KNR4 family (SUKH-1)